MHNSLKVTNETYDCIDGIYVHIVEVPILVKH